MIYTKGLELTILEILGGLSREVGRGGTDMRDMVNRIIVGVLTINGYSTPLASVRTFADLISDAPVFFTLLNAGSIQGAYWRIVHEVGVYVNPCLQELTHGYTHVQKCAGGVMLSNESPLDGGTYEKYTDDQR
jgi:hypothetical protein